MSCPYFEPLERCAGADDCHRAMLPLGDAWAGVCRAIPDQPLPPEPSSLVPLCNLGYARGACARFPQGANPDAVRFAVRTDDGLKLTLRYVIERDHLPFAHGEIEYSHAERLLPENPVSAGIDRQARAYIDSYLRRKLEASDACTASQ